MLQVKIDVQEGITQELRRIQRDLRQVPQDGVREFIALTPVRSGNARRKTSLKNNDTILANYAYAERLDDGYSNQAPRGMTVPFEVWLKKRLNKIFGR